MTDIIEKLGYLAGGSRFRRIYEQMQIGGDRVYKEAGLKFKSSWFPVYYVLSNSQEPQTVTEITNQIAFTHITVKNIVKELDKQQLIKIVPNPTDKRSKLISLSDHGLALLKQLEPIWFSFSTALKNVLTSGHPDIINILKRIDAELSLMPLDERVLSLNKGQAYLIRKAQPEEFEEIGKLMVQVYSQLDGFPSALEQPEYYKTLANIGALTKKPATELLVAVSPEGKIAGAVVYFSDMKYYGSGGTASDEKNASGFRLLAVDPARRGQGIGKLLCETCIQKAKALKQEQVIIHSTTFMRIAWKMYERMGFERSKDLDFMQGELPAFGFRLRL